MTRLVPIGILAKLWCRRGDLDLWTAALCCRN